jgi:hypothetical protein
VLRYGNASVIGPEVGHVTHVEGMVGVRVGHAERAGIVMPPGRSEIRTASPVLVKVKSMHAVRRKAFHSREYQHLRRDSLPDLKEQHFA